MEKTTKGDKKDTMNGLTKQQKLMVAVLLAGAVLVVLCATFLSPALPHIMGDMGVDQTTVQYLTSGYSLVEAVIIPMNAFLIGRFSTRKLFVSGMALFAAGAVVAACAPAFPILLLGRILQAFGTGVVMPMVFTLILLIFPRENRGAAMGIVGLIISFAPAIGPSLSGVLVDSVGWRMLFVIVACLTALVVAFAIFSLENFEGFERAPLDVPSVLLLACGMVGLLYGLSSFASSPTPLVPGALMVVGAGLLALFSRRQLHLEQPILRVDVLKYRRYRTAVLIIMLLEAALIGSEVVLPIYVQNVLGQPATVSGLIMLPGAVLGALMGLAAGRIFDKKGVRRLAVVGGIIIAVSSVCIACFQLDMSPLLVCAVYTCLGIGIQSLITPLNTWGVNSLDNSLIQHAEALGSTFNQVGASFGTALIASLSALGPLFTTASDERLVTYTGLHVSFCGMCAMLCLVAFLIFVFVRNRKGELAAEQAAQAQAVEGVPGVDREWLIADVMDPVPAQIAASAPVSEAITIMRDRHTSGLPVMGDGGRVVGFVSDGDVLKYLARQGGSYYTDGTNFYTMLDDQDFVERLKGLVKLPVENIATKNVIGVRAHQAAEDAFKVLSERRIKKVPVLGEDGTLLGTLSRNNVMIALAQLQETI